MAAITSTAPPPEPVAQINVVGVSKNAALIEWPRAVLQGEQQQLGATAAASAAAAASRILYRLLLSCKDQPFVPVATTARTSHEITDLQPNTQYRVQVVAELDGGASDKNKTQRFVTKGADSSSTTLTRPGSGGDGGDRLPAVRPSTHQQARSDRLDVASASQNTVAPPANLAPKPPTEPKGRTATSKRTTTATTGRTPRPEQLPPVAERSGAPSVGGTAVEELDVVAFHASDDEGGDH